ncbi:Rossmann-like domain-containing protein [Archaeoglobus sp.]
MNICSDLLSEDFKIVDFSFALPYTYVLIKGERGRSLGVAMSLVEDVVDYDVSFKDVSLHEFLKGLKSFNMIERCLGFATLNAISQYHMREIENFDVFEEMVAEGVERVAVVGNIKPLVAKLRKNFDVVVFERNPKLRCQALSDCFEYELLPSFDAVFVSGTALVNGTLELVVERARNAKFKVLIGPTAQIHPKLIRGLTHLASMKVVDVDRALMGLKLGSWRIFESACEKYTIRVK